MDGSFLSPNVDVRPVMFNPSGLIPRPLLRRVRGFFVLTASLLVAGWFSPFSGSRDIAASPLHKDRALEWDSGSAFLRVRTEVLATCRNTPTLTREFYVPCQRQYLLRFHSRYKKVYLFQHKMETVGSVSLIYDGK